METIRRKRPLYKLELPFDFNSITIFAVYAHQAISLIVFKHCSFRRILKQRRMENSCSFCSCSVSLLFSILKGDNFFRNIIFKYKMSNNHDVGWTIKFPFFISCWIGKIVGSFSSPNSMDANL